MGFALASTLTVPVSEGDYANASAICAVEQRPDALHHLGHAQQPLDPGQVHPFVLDQALDEAQPLDFLGRVEAHAAEGAGRPHQPQPLVLAQCLRVHVEQARSDRDEDQLRC